MADIEGDDGDNTINGTSGGDNIKGKEGQDTIDGNGGNDTLSGGAGNDNIDGGSGNDTIFGGDGDDIITGGAGDDIIIGGKGDDTMSAGNSSPCDTFVIRDGDGNDTITDFDPPEPDIIRFDMDEITSFQDVLDRISMDGSDTVITYDNGSTTRLLNVDSSSLSATNFEFGPGPVCLEAGTLIETPDGPVPIETLAPGDLVNTRDHGPLGVVQIIADDVTFRGRNDRRRPILIGQGALGDGKPKTDLVLSPQHRVLVTEEGASTPVLVAAAKLVGKLGIRRMKGRNSAQYFNVLMDTHQVIFANGCEVETLLLTRYVQERLAKLDVHLKPRQPLPESAYPIANDAPGSLHMGKTKRPLDGGAILSSHS